MLMLKKTVDYIVNEIYKDPSAFFPNEDYIATKEKNNGDEAEVNVSPKHPRRCVFKNLLIEVLQKFNKFRTVAGCYCQIDGLSMGSKLSPALANIYCHLMEMKLSNYINKHIIFYRRYVDDIFVIIDKKFVKPFLNKLNEFDKDYLSFTMEEPNERNELPFLDTLVFIDSKNVIQLKFYQKPNKPDVYTNFNKRQVF